MAYRLLPAALAGVLATGLAPRAWAQAQPGAPDEPAPTATEDTDASTPEVASLPDAEASPDTEEASWLEVGLDVDFGSAIETGFEDRAEDGTLPPVLQGLLSEGAQEVPRASARPRSRLGFRPLLGVAGVVPSGAEPAWGGAAGARLTHQWWSLLDRAVRPVGETRFDALGFFGGTNGHALQLESAAGAWLGPVALQLGGAGRLDTRRIGKTIVLGTALGLGPTGHVALRLGRITPFASVSPTWLVTGSRAGLEDVPWDELAVRGGVVLDRGPLDLRLTGGWRAVAAGQVWDAALGFHLSF